MPMGGQQPIPIFPLRTVLVPGMVLPLHIFEPRYRLMIRTLGERPEDERGFGVIAIRPGADPCNGGDAFYEVGTMARITEVTPLVDGRYDIVTVGARRFSIEDLDTRMPYLRAMVRLHPEPVGNPVEAATLARTATRLLMDYRAQIAEWGVIDLPGIEHLPSDPLVLSYLIGSAIVCDLPARQRLLDIVDAEQRLAAVCELLRHEIRVMNAMPSMPAVDLTAARPSAN